MDQHHDFGIGGGGRRSRKRDAGTRAAGGEAVPDEDPASIDEDDQTPPKLSDPVSGKWDSAPEEGRWIAEGQLADAGGKVDWRIEGWLAKQGTSVWYGAGSTGKTQLMLWMAAMVASQTKDRHEHIWLGGIMHGSGHVLILTAEDTREQILKRLEDVLEHSMDQDSAARRRTLRRLHVMPFLSMSEKEFEHPSPSLLEHKLQEDRDRIWMPTPVMREIRRYIWEWNRRHPDEEERIVGVVMDSATSMAGFDSLDAQATTNFFFYLGRLCERMKLFWAIIGHTPKAVSMSQHNWRETAASRLRGVAMWTTAPRLTVEVRLLQNWGGRKSAASKERDDLREILGPRVKRENILVVYVAKANLQQACREERYLVRLPKGAFVDVTKNPEGVVRSGVLGSGEEGDATEASPTGEAEAAPSARRPPPNRRKAAVGRPALDPAGFAPGTDLLRELLRPAYGPPAGGRRVSARWLSALLVRMRPYEPRAALVTAAWGGRDRDARPGAINWHFERLVAKGVLKRGKRFFELPDPSEGES